MIKALHLNIYLLDIYLYIYFFKNPKHNRFAIILIIFCSGFVSYCIYSKVIDDKEQNTRIHITIHLFPNLQEHFTLRRTISVLSKKLFGFNKKILYMQ
jgi:hypothetical protein